MSASATALPTLSTKDLSSDQEVRWCPGCGDYSILAQMKKALTTVGVPREKMAFVSGIGCSSRFPYYMNTYGFHTIHGRAPTFATGLRLANPDLQVWVVTGDGDGLSIGGNHTIHLLRRNVDVKVLLFNNEIYGLTKGQYSPTSRPGTKTKTSPVGSVESPIRPLTIALAAEATFVARTIDVDVQHLVAILQRAAAHKGTAFVEIYQNCKIFNDGVFEYATDKSVKAEHVLYLEHGKPMIFGKDRNKGIRLNGLKPEVVEIGKDCGPDDLLIHDETLSEPTLANLLSRMVNPEFPEVVGVLRAVRKPTYEELMDKQAADAVAKKGPGKIEDLFKAEDTWTVE
ncbi:2-oxoacid:ferredoxin oxidoreductase subunit beta [Fimbriiglobus ruber]|uniref:2-oxoglutarate oxidoreductase, beta subunit n=1 Tax=Fimbriiglobus ruber TaxID=1908690 RepID=A0A225E136_9BACT|nr:2-oxoacid:ferredoxin oxidoreductase subunit beta [Fimbriiglobus ruber]OWK44518.1 2-oxoglutarate oxidoreductase, beta subunit [Fimbriiglobus ruber]